MLERGRQYTPLINSEKEGIERGGGGWQYFPLINSKNEGLKREEGGGNIPPSSTQKTRDWREVGVAIFPPHQLKKRGIGDRKGGEGSSAFQSSHKL